MTNVLPNTAQSPRSLQRRKARRYQTTSLPAFNFGEVLDISATGMRVRRPGKPFVVQGAVERFVIVAGFGPLSLRGRVAWVRKPLPFRRSHTFGVQFLDLDDATRERLKHIGEYGFDHGPPPETMEQRATRKILAAVEIEDLYPILGVTPTASESDLAAAYRALVRKWHPDLNKDPGAEEQLARVTKAYKVLRDRDLRRKYDAMRAGAAAISPPQRSDGSWSRAA